MRGAVHTCLLLALVGASACSARRRAEDTLVRHVRFRGVPRSPLSASNPNALRQQMTQRATGRFALGLLSFMKQPELFEPEHLEYDRRPLEIHLAHEGWMDAELVRWEIVQRRRARRKKVAVVDVVGHVDLGPVVRWDTSTPEWVLPDGVDIDASWLTKLAVTRPGRRLQLDEVDALEADVRRALEQRGHARARVRTEVLVNGTKAHLRAFVDPGERYQVGPIAISGAGTLENAARDVARGPTGARWTAQMREQIAEDLRATGAFTRVSVKPGPGEGPALPVEIGITPGLPRRFEVSGWFGLVGDFWIPEARLRWTHDNAFGGLQRLSFSSALGVGVSPAREPVPLGELEGSLVLRRVGLRHLQQRFHVRGANALFESVLPRADVEVGTALEYAPRRETSVGVGLETGLTYLGTTPGLAQGPLHQIALGVGVSSPYVWRAVTARAAWRPVERRDTRLHGAEMSIDGRLAWVPGGLTPRLGVEAIGHLAPHAAVFSRPLQFTGRVRARRVFRDDAIWPERLFLGGATSLRGFRATGVGPYDSVCAERGAYGLRQVYLSRGGTTSGLASAEVQMHRMFGRDVALATFVDGGVLDDRVRGGVGVGARYETPLGPLRVDVAMRPLVPEDAGPTLGVDSADHGAYYGCAEPRRRAFDVFSEFGRRNDFDRSFPAINLLFSLGVR